MELIPLAKSKKTDEKEKEELSSEDSFKMDLFFWLQALVAALITLILLFTFVGRIIGVDGDSMYPTLHNGDLLLLQSVGYEPRQGDVVVLTKEFDASDGPIVKRVIAVGGQTVDIDYDEGVVYVDGEALDESYVMEPTYLDEGTQLPLTVPEGELFIMGDNRNYSRDSRSVDVGCVKEDEVVGRCLLRFYPLSRFGKISDTGRVVFE